MVFKDEDIVELYKKVFDKHKRRFGVDKMAIKDGIGALKEAYMPNSNWEQKQESKSPEYNEAEYRCAYLHKYAMLHTGLVCDVFQQALGIFSVNHAVSSKQLLNVCSLGSGPGTDIVSLIFVLADNFGSKQCEATLIDSSEQWQSVFQDIVSVLRSENFKYVHQIISQENFHYEYIGMDLLNFHQHDAVCEKIKKADIITMIKFVSAAACKDTRNMVMGIYQSMKPGALLLFIDNAAGGFLELMSETAEQCGLEPIFGPMRHYHYEKELFDHQYCNINSQFKSIVHAEMWKKSEITSQLGKNFLNRGYTLFSHFKEDFPVLECARSDDEVDYSQSESFRLQPEKASKSNNDCCLVM